jgi:hypothetical protein
MGDPMTNAERAREWLADMRRRWSAEKELSLLVDLLDAVAAETKAEGAREERAKGVDAGDMCLLCKGTGVNASAPAPAPADAPTPAAPSRSDPT